MAESSLKATAVSRLDGIQRMLSTTPEGEKHVLTASNQTGRAMVLNRPKALNSLTMPMVESIQRNLRDWEGSDLCDLIILKSNSPKAFCAGGDVVQVSREWKSGNRPGAMKFFQNEYQMNHHIATLKKPMVAILNGYTMGGGVGLSVHAPFRVANETTVFAMPETKIGFFPDVGASFFLPRLDGQTGVYLGLTGQMLKGRDLLYAGIATHYVPSERYPMLEQRLLGLGTSDFDAVNAAIEEFVAQPEDSHIDYSLAEVRDAIDTCFQYNTVEAIVQALEETVKAANPTVTTWAQTTLKQLSQMSPSSLKLTLEQLRRGAQLNIQQTFAMELGLAEKRLQSHDMHEGIEALLVRKSNDAQWDPATLDEVDVEALGAEYFKPEYQYKPGFVHDVAFSEYPH
ncbi:3-hydroxyisobutyryl-CoA hydrolase, partial [Coemansia sp. RSA 2708]